MNNTKLQAADESPYRLPVPRRRRDLEDIPSKVRRNMDILVIGSDEVFAACIEGTPCGSLRRRRFVSDISVRVLSF